MSALRLRALWRWSAMGESLRALGGCLGVAVRPAARAVAAALVVAVVWLLIPVF